MPEGNSTTQSTPLNLWNHYLGKVDPPLFWATGITTLLAVLYGGISPERFDTLLTRLQNWITVNFSWYFLLSVAAYLGVCIVIAFGKYGHLRLGQKDDRPEFSYFSWIAMLFSCGVGVGYIFWAVGEPILHYMAPPYLAQPQTPEAMDVAIEISVLHWGISAWAVFALAGLAIALPAYRLGKPMNVSISLYGLFGEKIIGSRLSQIIEYLAACATIVGVATSLGLGIISINAGIKHLFGSELSAFGMSMVMLFIIICYNLSAISGIQKGVKNLSQINIILAFVWGGFILVSGPTVKLLNTTVNTMGGYLSHFVQMSLWTNPQGDSQWLSWWTLFYWIWWISWAPFCGGFVARISKGRTVREFLVGVTVVPTLVAIVWFSVIGGTAQHVETQGIVPLYEALQSDMGSGIYVMLSSFPFGNLLNYVILLNLLIFLITSADSASFFVAMQLARGTYEPSALLKLICGTAIGSIGLVLLLSGGLQALQKASIIAGTPFSVVIILMIFSLFKMLDHAWRQEHGLATEPARASVKKEVHPLKDNSDNPFPSPVLAHTQNM